MNFRLSKINVCAKSTVGSRGYLQVNVGFIIIGVLCVMSLAVYVVLRAADDLASDPGIHND
jgi:hypothetical protein